MWNSIVCVEQLSAEKLSTIVCVEQLSAEQLSTIVCVEQLSAMGASRRKMNCVCRDHSQLFGSPNSF